MAWGDRVRILIGLVLVLVTAGFIAVSAIGFDEVFGEDSLPFSLCPNSKSATKATIPSRMSEETADYRGSGPHHVHVDHFVDPDYSRNIGGGDTHFALPEEWVVPLDGGQYVLDSVELIVCEYQYAVADEGVLGSCTYRDSTGATYQFTTLSAKYAYRVYEAATAKLLTSFDVQGEVAAKSGECADSMLIRPGEVQTYAAGPDIAELTRRLEPLVERDVP